MDNLGYIKLHRKIFDSKIFLEKPSDWLKIWLFILGNVNFCDNGVQAGSKFLKYDYIVHECRVTYKQVEKCISWLKKEGMVNIKRLPNGGIIEVAKWRDYQDENDIVKGNQKGIKRESKGNAINKNERMKEGNNNTSIEVLKEYKEKTPLELKIQDFLIYRKQLKKPILEASQKDFVNKLQKLSGGDSEIAIEILSQSIANGWQGIFELKESYSKNKGTTISPIKF